MVKQAIHFGHDVRVFHHQRRVEMNEVVLTEVVSQIRQHKRPLLSLLNRAGIQLDVIALPVNVDSLLPIIDDLRRRDHPAVANRKVEECQQIINVLRCQKVRCSEGQVEPFGNGDLRVPAWHRPILWNLLLDLHMHLESVRVEIKHDGLLSKPILIVNFRCNFIQVLINGLFNV